MVEGQQCRAKRVILEPQLHWIYKLIVQLWEYSLGLIQAVPIENRFTCSSVQPSHNVALT